MENAGSKIRECRRTAGKTQAWLAERLAVSTNTVARWERGELGISDAMLSKVLAELEMGDKAALRPAESAHRPVASTDPILQDITVGLGRSLDEKDFELCVVDLLRREHPRIAVVMGGPDGGSDGVIASEDGAQRTHVISTTSKQHLRNFKRSLKRLQETHPQDSIQAVFACSAPLTPRQRRTLHEAASAFGAVLVQAYGRDDLALRMRNRPDVARSLLNVSGAPNALSASVHCMPHGLDAPPPIGRDADLRWLTGQTGDCLLVGPPGFGKLGLFSALAEHGEALFAVCAESKQLANDVRRMEPLAVMVPDAHTQYGRSFLDLLHRIRAQQGADFRIIASSWPGKPADDVQVRMGIHAPSVRAMKRLDADVMAELVREMSGRRLPDELVQSIRRQAHGKPSLAARLAKACLAGDFSKALTGSALCSLLAQNFSERHADLLAALSLGGRHGNMDEQAAMEILGLSRNDMHAMLRSLQSQGVVEEAEPPPLSVGDALANPGANSPRQRHAVEPYDLRCAVIRRQMHTWRSTGVLDKLMDTFTPESRECKDAVRTLIGAALRGAVVPNLREWVIQQRDVQLLSDYAHVDEASALWVCEHYPHFMAHFAGALLELSPNRAVPMLLEHLSSGSDGDADADVPKGLLHPRQDTVLHHVREWTSGGPPDRLRPLLDEHMRRRSRMMEDVTVWLMRGANAQRAAPVPAIAFMCFAMLPTFECEGMDPGRGSRYVLTRGLLPADHLRRVAGMWPQVRDALQRRPSDFDVWEMLCSLAWDWMAPHRRGAAMPTDERKGILRATVAAMLQDMARLSAPMRGVWSRLQQMAAYMGLDLQSPALDAEDEFRVLNPVFPLDKAADWGALRETAHADARRLGVKWGRRSPKAVVEMLHGVLRDALFCRRTSHVEDVVPAFCRGVAETMRDGHAEAVRLLTDAGFEPRHIDPFLRACVKDGEAGWQDAVRDCLRKGAGYAYCAVEAIMTTPHAESELGDVAYSALLDMPNACDAGEMLALRDQLPQRHILSALRLAATDSGRHVNGNRKLRTFGNWKLHTLRGNMRRASPVFPWCFPFRLGRRAKGAERPQPGGQGGPSRWAVTAPPPLGGGRRRPPSVAWTPEVPGAPSSGSCCPGC